MSPRITVYIDEAGDPGVKDGIRYYDDRYEWLCLSAYVIRTERDIDLVQRVRELRSIANAKQAEALHYHKITRTRRESVCAQLATHSARAFVVASHKSNMREYINPRIGTKLASDKFYNWAMRLLLERVTDWSERWLVRECGGLEPLKLVFAERGGHDYDHMFAYFARLKMQAESSGHFLPGRGLHPTLLDRAHWTVRPAAASAGLQLADTVASAFAQAVNCKSPSFDVEPAKALAPIMGQSGGTVANHGLLLLPFRHQGVIPADSWPIFEHYGYRK